MDGNRTVECFNTAKKLIFDSSWNHSKSPHVVALVFDKFTPLVQNTARELRTKNESDQFIILFDAYQENLVRFSLINKQQKLEYTSCCFPYSTEEFKSFYEQHIFYNKIIFTFFQSYNRNEMGLLLIKGFHPFFLYLECYFLLPEGRSVLRTNNSLIG